MPEMKLRMSLFKENFGISRLKAEASIPEWSKTGPFYSITKTTEELSMVCLQHAIPSYIKCERDRRLLKVEGPLDFSLIGIISAISTALAKRGISIFTISTYDTDYILVKNNDIDKAIETLIEVGYEIVEF